MDNMFSLVSIRYFTLALDMIELYRNAPYALGDTSLCPPGLKRACPALLEPGRINHIMGITSTEHIGVDYSWNKVEAASAESGCWPVLAWTKVVLIATLPTRLKSLGKKSSLRTYKCSAYTGFNHSFERN